MSPSPITLTTRAERWPIAGTFTISRGAKTEAAVVVAELSDGTHRGRGECVPYARYGETVESVVAAIDAMRPADRARPRPHRPATGDAAGRGAQRARLRVLGSGGQARRAGRRMSLPASPRRSRSSPPTRSRSATPDEMAVAAAKAADRALLKVKLGGAGDPERIAAVRRAAPACRADRRRQRSLDAAEPDRQPRRLRGRRRDADRAAAARRPRRRAVRLPASGADLRRRKRARARFAGGARATNTTPSTSSSTRPAA